jgi:polysaccharide export outer membrane protein
MGFTLLGMFWVGLVGLFWVPGVLSAAWQQASAPTAGGAPAVDLPARQGEETLISAYDLLFIQVFDVEQMTREYRVSGTGAVDFPLLPEAVPVAGLSPQQAAKAISQRCIAAGVLSHPQISITIRDSRLHSVAVAGAVKSPQIYPVFGRISLVDLLTLAGGVEGEAGSVITITRGEVSRRLLAAQAGNEPAAGKPAAAPANLNINLQQLLDNGDPSLNVDVYPGDRVTVPRAGVIYVLGAVNRAGGYLLSEARLNMTVLKAVALAGYLSPFAKSKNVVLLRNNPSAPSGREQIPINLKAMLKGSLSDRPMQNNDILFVPDSTMLRALHRGVDVGTMIVSYAGAAAIIQ